MKYRYSVNNNNQLLIKSSKAKVAILVRGSFSIDKNNQLIYWLNEPAAWRRIYNFPAKVSFIGNWKLNSNYDLELNLDETKNQYKADRLILKGEIISTDRDTLAFEIISYNKQGLSPTQLNRSSTKGTVPESTHIQLLKLTGSWQADEYNQLSFVVKKRTSPDVLTLEGGWQINNNQQVTYAYEKAGLKTKSKILHTFTFIGFWQINSNHRLTYILGRSLNSRFDFRVQLESPSIYPQEGTIKYRIGIGLRQQKPYQAKIISLYGTWKFSRKVGFLFQMDYGGGKIGGIEFGATLNLDKKNQFVFALTDTRGEPLGINITFTHRFLKKFDAETFLRFKGVQKEKAIETGIRIPF